MVVNIKNIAEILDNKLSLIERGILITALLLKEEDPKLTLAKVKAKIKIATVRAELINLHETGSIKWSGYKAAKKALEKERISPDVVSLIKFMNELYRTNFNPNLRSVNTGLINRLENNTVDDIKMVIANRYAVWKEDATMAKYLTPYTIFRPSKFDKYLEEANRTRKGESYVNVSNINLKGGEEITSKISKTFIDHEKYKIKIWRVGDDGYKTGNGMVAVRTGKAIRKSLKVQEYGINLGNKREFIYTYIAK